ncbi:MAG TPA: cation-translocating P-type ATPase [Actinobacteria bacterium]|nr:cation-translocating P-type ATPase [Actinomycetota bacterium]
MPDTAAEAPAPDQIVFDVEGMTCASCALRIERILSKQVGIASTVVNFAGQEARVMTNTEVDVASLVQSVERIGYEITVKTLETDRVDVVERYSDEERYQRRNFLGSLAFTIPVLILAWFIPESRSNGIAQWGLATVSEFYFGRQFHVAAAKRLRGFTASMDTLISIGTLAAWGTRSGRSSPTGHCSSTPPPSSSRSFSSDASSRPGPKAVLPRQSANSWSWARSRPGS